jgi:hypothetical protein
VAALEGVPLLPEVLLEVPLLQVALQVVLLLLGMLLLRVLLVPLLVLLLCPVLGCQSPALLHHLCCQQNLLLQLAPAVRQRPRPGSL